MVGRRSRHRIPYPAMAPLPHTHVHSACVVSFHVGTRFQLAFRPKYFVLGCDRFQDVRLAHDFSCSLVDSVGKAIAESQSVIQHDSCLAMLILG